MDNIKKISTDKIFLGGFLLASGLILTFAPDLISRLFYAAGAVLMLFNIFQMAVGIIGDKAKTSVPKGAAGIILGIVMIIIPRFITIGLPFIIGIFFLISGVSGFFSTLENNSAEKMKKFSKLVSYALLVICGLFFMSNPAKVSDMVTKIIGIAFICAGGAMLLFAFLKIKAPDGNSADEVIEITDYKIDD